MRRLLAVFSPLAVSILVAASVAQAAPTLSGDHLLSTQASGCVGLNSSVSFDSTPSWSGATTVQATVEFFGDAGWTYLAGPYERDPSDSSAIGSGQVVPFFGPDLLNLGSKPVRVRIDASDGVDITTVYSDVRLICPTFVSQPTISGTVAPGQPITANWDESMLSAPGPYIENMDSGASVIWFRVNSNAPFSGSDLNAFLGEFFGARENGGGSPVGFGATYTVQPEDVGSYLVPWVLLNDSGNTPLPPSMFTGFPSPAVTGLVPAEAPVAQGVARATSGELDGNDLNITVACNRAEECDLDVSARTLAGTPVASEQGVVPGNSSTTVTIELTAQQIAELGASAVIWMRLAGNSWLGSARVNLP